MAVYNGVDMNIMNKIPSLKLRHFQSISEGDACANISVMTYNILAESAVPLNENEEGDFGGYAFCPIAYRRMSNRHPRMMKEIEVLTPDVVCMQEVEASHFSNALKNDMSELGYSSRDFVRSSDHLGLAIFYKTSKLNLVNEQNFIVHKEIRSFLKRNGINEETSKLTEKFMEESSKYPECPRIKPIGCMMAKFTTIDSNQTFYVTNIHISYKQFKFPVLQMLQVAAAIEESHSFSNGSSVILTGDFNCEPKSPLHKYVQRGYISENTLRRLKEHSYKDPHMEIAGQKAVDIIEKFKNIIKFSSAYHEVVGREPSHTSTDEFEQRTDGQGGLYQSCLDYIWVSEGIKPVSVLKVPNPEETQFGMPNETFPSDHLPLMAYLAIR